MSGAHAESEARGSLEALKDTVINNFLSLQEIEVYKNKFNDISKELLAIQATIRSVQSRHQSLCNKSSLK